MLQLGQGEQPLRVGKEKYLSARMPQGVQQLHRPGVQPQVGGGGAAESQGRLRRQPVVRRDAPALVERGEDDSQVDLRVLDGPGAAEQLLLLLAGSLLGAAQLRWGIVGSAQGVPCAHPAPQGGGSLVGVDVYQRAVEIEEICPICLQCHRLLRIL